MGSYQIQSILGKGTLFSIRLPLTLAIFNGMIIRVGSCQYVIPNSDIQEVVRPEANADHRLSKKDQIIQIKDAVYPLVDLSQTIAVNTHPHQQSHSQSHSTSSSPKTAVIIRANNKKFALLVDEVISQQRVVHKSLGPEMKSFAAAAGATILGDGSVALILEISTLLSEGSLPS